LKEKTRPVSRARFIKKFLLLQVTRSLGVRILCGILLRGQLVGFFGELAFEHHGLMAEA